MSNNKSEERKQKVDTVTLLLTPQMYPQYNAPAGWLTNSPECHALWHYYLLARHAFETAVQDPMVYEGELDSGVDFRQLFLSVATLYGVEPERMVRHWMNVDMQAWRLQLPKLPNEDKYRFNKAAEIKTQ